ncbi:MAG TPA: hypothetical protein VGL03_11865 [Thermoanaerobaculia bacterium]
MLKRTWERASAGLLLLLFGVILAVSACGKKEQAAVSPAPAAAAPAVAVPTPPPASQAPAAAAPAAAPAASAAPGGLGVQEHEFGGVDVVLLEVKRTSGDTLTLKWQYRSKAQEDKELDPQDATGWGLSRDAYLVDSVNKKKYFVVRDSKGAPLVAEHRDTVARPGQTLTTWAKFPAPPPDVPTISVFIPHVPPFDDIPISK